MATTFTPLILDGVLAAGSAALAVEAQYNAVVATLANMESTMTTGSTSVNLAQLGYALYSADLTGVTFNKIITLLTAYDPSYIQTGADPVAPKYYTVNLTASTGQITGTFTATFTTRKIAGPNDKLPANTVYTVTRTNSTTAVISPTTGLVDGTGIVVVF